jgi:hypothetical protein
MQAAWRAEEEPDNRLRPATMQAAWRLGEQPDKRFLTSPMRQISTARRYPVMVQVRAPNAPDRSGTEA